jgi:hypothetical protein
VSGIAVTPEFQRAGSPLQLKQLLSNQVAITPAGQRMAAAVNLVKALGGGWHAAHPPFGDAGADHAGHTYAPNIGLERDSLDVRRCAYDIRMVSEAAVRQELQPSFCRIVAEAPPVTVF